MDRPGVMDAAKQANPEQNQIAMLKFAKVKDKAKQQSFVNEARQKHEAEDEAQEEAFLAELDRKYDQAVKATSQQGIRMSWTPLRANDSLVGYVRTGGRDVYNATPVALHTDGH